MQTEPASELVTTRELPPLHLRASFRPSTVNEETRTVEVVWTTGARVLRGFFDPFYEELSLDPKHVRMDRLTSGRAPLLAAHDGRSLDGVIGVVENARVDGKQGIATVRFPKAEDDEEADKIFRKVRDGIIGNVSVGYRVYKFEKVEGGEEKIPVYRAVDWEPYELSLVGMPADAGARVRAAADAAEAMPCVFVRKQESKMENQTQDTMSASAPALPSATEVTARAVANTTGQSAEDAARAAADAATRAERERVVGIRTAVRKAKLGENFADELIRDGISLAAAREKILDKLAEADEAVRTEQHTVEITDDERDKWQRGAAAWLFNKAGLAATIADAKKKEPDHAAFRGIALDPGEFRGLTLVDIARESLERAGVKTRGLNKLDLVGKALTHRSAYATTSDFAVLLENTMHKTLLAAYATTPDTWTRFCRVGSLSDFRPHHRYRTGSFGRLDRLNEHGEFRNKRIPDGERSTIQAETFGNIIGLSRQAIVNDDMGAFTDLATRLGRAARLSIEVDVYALIRENNGLGPTQSDGQPLFHSNRANVGEASELSVEGLDQDRVLMAQQKDPEKNEFLDLRPAILLVPIGLGGTARVINDAQYDPDTPNKLQRPNKVRGLVRDIIDTPRLEGTRRYLLADPAIAPVFEVAFLDGQQEPFLESQDGWRVDGVEWKVRLDYGVAAIDFRGAVTNAGTKE